MLEASRCVSPLAECRTEPGFPHHIFIQRRCTATTTRRQTLQRGRPGRSSAGTGNSDAELNQCIPTQFLPKSGISCTGGVLTRAQHYLLSAESRECLALHRNSVFALKLLQAQSNSDAEVSRLLGKNSNSERQREPVQGCRERKKSCRQGTVIR